MFIKILTLERVVHPASISKEEETGKETFYKVGLVGWGFLPDLCGPRPSACPLNSGIIRHPLLITKIVEEI